MKSLQEYITESIEKHNKPNLKYISYSKGELKGANIYDVAAGKLSHTGNVDNYNVAPIIKVAGQPTPKEFAKYCEKLTKIGSAHKVLIKLTEEIFENYPYISIMCGDENLKTTYPLTWDEYSEGINILINAYPELNKEN